MLAEPDFTQSLTGYRVAALGGEIQLTQGQLGELTQWVRDGGVVLAFASQLRLVDGHAEFVGVHLSNDSSSVHVRNVTDDETKWSSSEAIDQSKQQPFCVSQGGASSSYYIKTGGNPSVKSGWDNGVNDKCCTSALNTCRWYTTLQECTAALAGGADCLPCASCNGTGSPLSCPQWQECGGGQTLVLFTATGSMGTNTSALLSAGVTLTNNQTQRLPAVLRNHIGAGSVLTVLLEDADALRTGRGRTGAPGYGVFSHLLGRMADDVLPIDLLDVATGAIDMKSQLQLLLGQSEAGWHVTLINNHGVTKHPSKAAVIDASKAVSAVLTMKTRYGTLESATLASDSARRQLPVINGRVVVTVPPGGVVVVELGLKQP